MQYIYQQLVERYWQDFSEVAPELKNSDDSESATTRDCDLDTVQMTAES